MENRQEIRGEIREIICALTEIKNEIQKYGVGPGDRAAATELTSAIAYAHLAWQDL